MTMKIENYETYKAGISADTFTFPYNSRVVDVQVEKFLDQRDFAYAFTYYGVTDPLKSRSVFALDGHFSGTSKETDFRSFKRHLNDNELKALYFGTDKFAIGFGSGVQRVHTGGRTNFIDYVAGFTSPFGILFGSSQKNGLKTESSESNEGDVFTPFEKISGSVSSGDTVTIADADGNGFQFVASTTGTFTLYLVYLSDLGGENRFTEYWYGVIGSAEQTLKLVNNDKNLILGLEAAETPNDIFGGGTITNITPTFYWRDGYSAE